jgi:hypothetical protein
MDKTLELVLEQLKEKRQQLIDAVATNSCRDFAEYQKLCGEIRGLSIAEGFILDLVNLINKGEDEDL